MPLAKHLIYIVHKFKLVHFLADLFPAALFFDPAFLAAPFFEALLALAGAAAAAALLLAAAFGALLIALDFPAFLAPFEAALFDLLATCPLAKIIIRFSLESSNGYDLYGIPLHISRASRAVVNSSIITNEP